MLSATIEGENAKLEEFASNILDASGRISAAEGELHAAVKARESEHADFLASEKALLATVGELESAAHTVKQSFSLAQLPRAAKQHLHVVLAGLSKIVEASFVTQAQRDKVRAFLQARADSGDELALPTESHSGTDTIVETIEAMTEKAESTLGDVRKAEAQGSHEHMLLKTGIEHQIKSTTQELSENTQGKALSTQAFAQAKKALSVAEESLSQDQSYVSDLKRDCQEKARSWEFETRDAQAELKALDAAKAILSKKFQKGAFIQSKATLVAKSNSHPDSESPKARALRRIQELGEKLHSTALVALSYRAASDPLGKVRGLIEDMIMKLQQEAAEAATHKAFCDAEVGQSTKSKNEKQAKLDKTTARIETAEATLATLSEQIATLASEIAEIDSAVTVATTQRSAEKTTFATSEADFSASEEACGEAIAVLREYYEGFSATLVQTGSDAQGQAKGQTQDRDGSGIISLLEVAQSEFAKLLGDARTGEMMAAKDFDRLMQDSKLAKATKVAEQEGKMSEAKSLKTLLVNHNEDKDGISSELEAVKAYLAELRPQCETGVPSYAEVKAKREAEIVGLRDAVRILEADVMLAQKGSLRSSRRSA